MRSVQKVARRIHMAIVVVSSPFGESSIPFPNATCQGLPPPACSLPASVSVIQCLEIEGARPTTLPPLYVAINPENNSGSSLTDILKVRVGYPD